MSLPGAPPWSRASAPIWARVSGYSWPARCDKPLAFIRAFFDDSASDSAADRRLFLAGYINRAEHWALFSDAWDEELKSDPPIDYLKMAEAQNLKEQFSWRNGWTEEKRDQKLRGLARVIRHFEPLSFQISIDREFFYRTAGIASPRGLASPYFDCCAATVVSVAAFGANANFSGPIEFIFDKQDGVEDNIKMFFAYIVPHFKKRVRAMIEGTPKFVDDKQYRPVQAADMLAWHLRREHETGEQLPLIDVLRVSGRHLITEIPNSMVQRWADHNDSLPGVDLLRSKSQWRNFKREFTALTSRGIDLSKIKGPGIYYPKGTPWHIRLGDKIRRLFLRFRARRNDPA